MLIEIRQSFRVDFAFPVCFTRGVFEPANRVLCDVLRAAGPGRHRVLPVIDSGVADALDDLVARIGAYAAASAATIELVAPPHVVPGGERCKSGPAEVDRIHALVERHGLCRHSFVLAVGGGAVLDVAGYSTATAHRGLRLIRLPTTTLAQADAGVGVKNGVNAFGRKSFLGTFAPPFAVINDFDFLQTLPARDLRAGVAEAVKVAAIQDAAFFAWLHERRHALAALVPQDLKHMIVRCAELHIEHIRSGDPFELGSARPLDFGHWSAHKLEELTRGQVRHGEAVAVGVALDSLYACRRGLLTEAELARMLTTLEDVGFATYHTALRRIDVQQALGHFREHLGGEPCVTMPHGLGRKVEVHEIDVPLMRRCIGELEERHERKEEGSHDQADMSPGSA
jgi:3-dehydroquinate synthase